jgi:hypothetical protein
MLIPSTLKMEVAGFFETFATTYYRLHTYNPNKIMYVNVTLWRVRVTNIATETQEWVPLALL